MTWELTLFSEIPPEVKEMGSLGVEDLDGDGIPEVYLGSNQGLWRYNPATFELSRIASGHFHVGLVFEDVDGDGRLELVVGEEMGGTERWGLSWYRPDADPRQPWQRFLFDATFEGGPHDIVFADLDGDGQRELVAIACYTSTPGIYILKPGAQVTLAWQKYPVVAGVFAEGLSIGDLTGDGRLEIVCGPDWYRQPEGGPFSGPWQRSVFAPNFREMCRTALVDINGNGRLDIVITDSEYMDGALSWFENPASPETRDQPWPEHRLAEGLLYAHSLDVRRSSSPRPPYPADGQGDCLHIFVAEMEAGGWDAPFNPDARLLCLTTQDRGQTWTEEVIERGEGTHQAIFADLDRDGFLEVAGKSWGYSTGGPKIQTWKWQPEPALRVTFRHVFIDRAKPFTGIDVLSADIDGDGLGDVLCGAWWYRNPGAFGGPWPRYTVPEMYQAVAVYDIDGDGRLEVVGIKRNPNAPRGDFYAGLSSDLWWFKPLDPLNGIWQEHWIGRGNGDWPHGALVAPLLPGSRLALVTCYHGAGEADQFPEIFEAPDDPTQPWRQRCLAEIHYSEQVLAHDLNQNGLLDLVCGGWWLENLGDGSFRAHRLADFPGARLAIADFNDDGRPDVIMGAEVMDYPKRKIPFSNLSWFAQPADPGSETWQEHIIDRLRCAHSIGAADLDGDGLVEVVAGEHDPFWPYRKRNRLLVYQQANPQGTAWRRWLVDGRFEHHDGAKVFELSPGTFTIVSHGWKDSLYLNAWQVVVDER